MYPINSMYYTLYQFTLTTLLNNKPDHLIITISTSSLVSGTPVETLPGEEEQKVKGQGFYLKDGLDPDKVKRSMSVGGGEGHQTTYLEDVHGNTKTTPDQCCL